MIRGTWRGGEEKEGSCTRDAIDDNDIVYDTNVFVTIPEAVVWH